MVLERNGWKAGGTCLENRSLAGFQAWEVFPVHVVPHPLQQREKAEAPSAVGQSHTPLLLPWVADSQQGPVTDKCLSIHGMVPYYSVSTPGDHTGDINSQAFP